MESHSFLDIQSYIYNNKIYIPYVNWVIDLSTLELSIVDVSEIHAVFKKDAKIIYFPHDYTWRIKKYLSSKDEIKGILDSLKTEYFNPPEID